MTDETVGIEPPYLTTTFDAQSYRANIRQLRDFLDVISAPWNDSDTTTNPGSEGFPTPAAPMPPPDGFPPASSPTPVVLGGPGYLSVKWDPVTNVDPVTYDVHISTTSGFTPGVGTLVGVTPGALYFIRQMPDASPLIYGVTYFVRVVAKDADGAAAASAQAAGVMVQVDTEDIAVDAITADQILAGSITAEKLEAILVLATKIVAGASITSPRTEMDANGVHIFADAENIVAELTGTTLSFGTLYAGQIFSPSILLRNDLDFTLYVDPATGDDANDGSSGAKLATLQSAIGRVPRYNQGDVTILITASSTLDELVDIEGFVGSGSLTIDGQGSTVSGTVLVAGCNQNITVLGLSVFDDGEGDPGNTVVVLNSSYVDLDLTVRSNGLKATNIRFNGSRGIVHDSDLSGSTARCVAAENQSMVQCTNNIGSGSSSYRSNASVIFATGTRPTGGTTTANEGRIFDDGGSTSAGSGGSSSKRTKYYSALSTASWRTWDNDWRSDNDYVYQGGETFGNHKGLWFYDDAQIRSDLAGKTIDSIQIYVRRRSEGGFSAAQGMRWKTHNYHTRPGGEPSLSGGSDIGSLAWGDTRWITLPDSFAADLRDNVAKGVAVHFPGTTGYNHYVLLDGENEMDFSGRLKITYH